MACDFCYFSFKVKSQRRFLASLILLTSIITLIYYATVKLNLTSSAVLTGKMLNIFVDLRSAKELETSIDNSTAESSSDSEWCLDIHLDETGFTKTCAKHSHGDIFDNTVKQIALGGGITSVGLDNLHKEALKSRMPFFRTLLPSFCRTCTASYHYHFYWAYDYTDSYFKDESNLKDFGDVFVDEIHKHCSNNIKVSLHMVQCSHFAKPAWAQNDAMMEAYMDNMEYFYRLNDDTEMLSSGWTDSFIETLASYNPPNVGVVGPTHSGGNVAILTYDFTHKTHISIFGFHYPRVLTDWFADDWVTTVYQPGRSTKLKHILLHHTLQMGQRYKNDLSKEKIMASLVGGSKTILQRYIRSKEAPSSLKADGTRVIAMSLYGSNTRYTYGAIRNAQLLSVHFPGWNLRLYVPDPEGEWPKEVLVSDRVLSRLKLLGADIVYVHSNLQISPQFFHLLVADNSSVNYFIIRNADYQLSDRDMVVVDDWLSAGFIFHCIRDHPNHATQSIVNGLWGGKQTEIVKLLGQSMLKILLSFLQKEQGGTMSKFLNNVLWPIVKDYCYCHDSVSCDKWPGSVKFPLNSYPATAYLGQKFDVFQNSLDNISFNSSNVKCSGPSSKPSL